MDDSTHTSDNNNDFKPSFDEIIVGTSKNNIIRVIRISIIF